MQRGRKISYNPTILIQRNDYTSLEARDMYITNDPTIRLHSVKNK